MQLRRRPQSGQKFLPNYPPRFGCLLVARCDTRIRGWGHADMACKVSLNCDTIKHGVLLLAVVGVALQPGDRWSNFRWWRSLGKVRSSHDFASPFTGMVGLVAFPDIYIAFSTLVSLRTGSISHRVLVVLGGVIAFRGVYR